MLVGFELLVVVRIAVNEIVIMPVAVKVAHPDKMDLAAGLDIDDADILQRTCRERICTVTVGLFAVLHELDGIGIVLAKIRLAIRKIGAPGEGGIV